jgi:hypothetical protein
MATTQPGRQTKRPAFVESTRATLAAEVAADAPVFDPTTLRGLPAPAQRFLGRALPAGVRLSSMVELDMEGEIKLGGRWIGFTAEQILRAGVGFVWTPIVGGRFLRFVGADALGPDEARIDFRFHGRIPIVRGSGPDIRRSAQGRLAAETVAWLPQALTPQSGARWTGVDDERAIVTINAAGVDVDVDVAVDRDGRIRSLGLQRWKDAAKPPEFAPFGGSVDATFVAGNGVRIAGSGTVGWDWHTPREPDGVCFRYRIRAADFGRVATTPAPTADRADPGVTTAYPPPTPIRSPHL